MRIPRYLMVPALWLYLGPPAWRPVAGRSAMDSLAGNFDVWNFVRIGWWGVVGLVALAMIYHLRTHLKEFVRSLPLLAFWTLVWVGSLVASAAYSPSWAFTLANAIVMTVLVVAGLQLALSLHAGATILSDVLASLYGFSLMLMAFVWLTYLVDPTLVTAYQWTGPRVMGNFVAEMSFVSVVTFFLAAHAAARSRGSARWFHGVVMAASVAALLATQTRTAYLSLGLGGAYMFLQWFTAASNRARVGAIAVIAVVIGLSPLALEALDASTGASTLDGAIAYLLRDDLSWRTASGRTAIAGVLMNDVLERPWGLGYSAGPRVLLLTSHQELIEGSVHAESIGNAHNVFLEVLGGSGLVGLFAFTVVLAWVAVVMHSVRHPGLVPVRVLVLCFVLAGMTGSNGVLPFYQSSALLWILVGAVAGVASARGRPQRVHDANSVGA